MPKPAVLDTSTLEKGVIKYAASVGHTIQGVRAQDYVMKPMQMNASQAAKADKAGWPGHAFCAGGAEAARLGGPEDPGGLGGQ